MAHFDDQTAKDLEFDVVKTLLLNHCHNPRLRTAQPNCIPGQSQIVAEN